MLRNAKPKLRKAILSNCNKVLVNTISESVFKVLKGNLKLAECQKKLENFRVQFHSVVRRRVSLSVYKKLINQRGRFLMPLLSAILPNVASLIFRSRDSWRKHYCVKCTSYHQNTRTRAYIILLGLQLSRVKFSHQNRRSPKNKKTIIKINK